MRHIDNIIEILLQIRYWNFDSEMIFVNLRHSFPYHSQKAASE